MIIDVINLEDKVDICCKAEASIFEQAHHFPILEHFNIDTYLNFILNLMKTDCDFRSYPIIKLMHEDFLEDIFYACKELYDDIQVMNNYDIFKTIHRVLELDTEDPTISGCVI